MSDLTSRLKEIFTKTKDVEFAYLFGSYANGKNFSTSDIDIAAYLKLEHNSLDTELKLHSLLSRELKSNTVDLTIINKITNIILLEDIIRYGKVICDNNLSLHESFELNALHNAIDFKYQRKIFAGV